jgi:hypothetical protein
MVVQKQRMVQKKWHKKQNGSANRKIILETISNGMTLFLLNMIQIPSVKEEIRRFSIQYSSRLQTHPNSLAVHLTEPPEHRRLKRHLPTDLITRFHE